MNGPNEGRKWRHKEGMGTLFTLVWHTVAAPRSPWGGIWRGCDHASNPPPPPRTNCWGYWPWEGGENKEREGGRGRGKSGEGLRWFTVHSGCLTYREFILSSKRPTHTRPEVYTHGHCWRQRDRKRRVVQIKRRQWTQHHNCWNQSLQFQASFSPQVIDYEHTQHYWIHAGQNAGVSRTNKHPLPWPRSASDKFTILFFLKSQSMGVDTLDWPGDRGWKGGRWGADKQREAALFQ